MRATWQSYQLELASEKLLWGKPLCGRSSSYSINLGPGALGPSRSSTDHFGFLSFEVYSTCMQNEYSIPPQEIWTTSEVISKMIARSVGLHDHWMAAMESLVDIWLLPYYVTCTKLARLQVMFFLKISYER